MQIITHLCLYFVGNLCYPAGMKQILSKIPPAKLLFAHHFSLRHALHLPRFRAIAASISCVVLLLASCGLQNYFRLFHSAQTSSNVNQLAETVTNPSEPSTDQPTNLTDSSDPANPANPTVPLDPADPTDPAETTKRPSSIWITAINPGYTVSGVRESGELIELQRVPDSPKTPLSLAGYTLRYTNSSGKQVDLYEFPEGSTMVGENLLMRLTRSPHSDWSDATYSTTLAMSAGPLELLYQGEVVDSVCWTGVKKNSCLDSFDKNSPTTLVRDLVTGEFSHQLVYDPQFDPAHPSLILPSIPDDVENKNQPPESGTPHCQGLEFSEIYAYYINDKTEQFIELYNSTDHEITLDGCALRYKKKDYSLTGTMARGAYWAYYPAANFILTKNPTSSNIIEIYDEDGSRVDIAEYYHGQKRSTSYARFYDNSGAENWNYTYAPTPNAENIFQEFRSCPEGKVINPDTGNCVKSTNATSTLKDCGPGKYRSPITNRCRNIEADESTLKPCAPGYERNPETHRCRKVASSNSGADYALVPSTHTDRTAFIAAGIVILLVSLGVFYIIFQFRREILRTLRKIRQRLHHITKNLIARCRRLHRQK